MDSISKKTIIDYIFSKGILNVDSLLESVSCISIEAIGLNNTLKGFIINTKKIIKNFPKKYVFFVYSKIPGKLFYFLSDDDYNNLIECKNDLNQYVKLFPFFGFRKSHCMTLI